MGGRTWSPRRVRFRLAVGGSFRSEGVARVLRRNHAGARVVPEGSVGAAGRKIHGHVPGKPDIFLAQKTRCYEFSGRCRCEFLTRCHVDNWWGTSHRQVVEVDAGRMERVVIGLG